MTTYTHPHTFCLIVVELIANRGWKIRKRTQPGILTLSLPDGLAAVSGEGKEQEALSHAFLDLCKKFAKQEKLPIAFDEEAFKESIAKGQRAAGVDEEKIYDILFSNMGKGSEFFRQMDQQMKGSYPGTWGTFSWDRPWDKQP